jgi:hypothetical protein
MASRTDSQSAPLIVHGSRALQLPKPSRRYEEERICSHPGCNTRLSAYNAYETCYNHTFAWSARKTASARRSRVKAPVLTEVPAPQATAPAEAAARATGDAEFAESSRIAS